MVIRKIRNNSGSTIIIWLIIISLVFVLLSVFFIDFANLYMNNKKIKSSVNLAVKAASLQIKEDSQLASGNFNIDEIQAYEAFIKILTYNLNLDKITLEPLEYSILTEKPIIKEFEVINNTPNEYNSIILGNTFEVNNPSVFAVIEFKTKTMFINGDIRVDKLSSSQLTSIYE